MALGVSNMTFFKPHIVELAVPAPHSRATGRSSAYSKSRARAPLAENTLLGSQGAYRIEKLIGMGSFSLIYSAVDTRTRLNVVIKEYFPKRYAKRKPDDQVVSLRGNRQMAFTEGVRRFYNEALMLKKVSHPNVLDVHDLVRANSTTYLVSLNKGGRDLKWFLSSFAESLEQDLICKVFMPILSALHFMHDAQLLHLDIKPANILLQPNSESLLLDFGAAQMMDTEIQARHKRIVTHGYAPPEQYEKRGNLGPWTDIYAMGAAIYFCITARPPVKSKGRTVASQLEVECYSDEYSTALLHAVNRALSYEISERFDSVDEFAAALLNGSRWASLSEYEAGVMAYDRNAQAVKRAQKELANYAD